MRRLPGGIWGECRADSEDDVIHLGAREMRVDLTLMVQDQRYRVLRSRQRQSATSLEFQVWQESGFRSLTSRTLKATQQVIRQHLRMDYHTFIHSSYLRQGKADELMLKRPGERKQILSDLLGLEEYEQLAEAARDVVRLTKGELTALAHQHRYLEQQQSQRDALMAEQQALRTECQRVQALEAADRQRLQQLEAVAQEEQRLRERSHWLREQGHHWAIELHRAITQQQQIQERLDHVQEVVSQREAILAAYAYYQSLCHEDGRQHQLQQQGQQWQQHLAQLQQELTRCHSDLQSRVQQQQHQWQHLQQQWQDLQPLLQKAADIEQGFANLQRARQHLHHLEQIQEQTAPLRQRQQVLHQELEHLRSQIYFEVESLEKQWHGGDRRCRQQEPLQAEFQHLEQQIAALDKQQVYCQRVYEKGLERKDFLERLNLRIADLQAQQEKLLTKNAALVAADSLCPLCDRPLDDHHRQRVYEKHQVELQELHNDLWVLHDQRKTSECEIQILRDEYRQLRHNEKLLPGLLEKKGQVQAQLEAIATLSQQQQSLGEQIAIGRSRLAHQDYGHDQREELRLIEHQLHTLNYDERNLALARSEVERWRWAELKAGELKTARRQAEALHRQLPELQHHLTELQQRLECWHINPELQRQIQHLEAAIAQLNYDAAAHQKLRHEKERSTAALLRYQELQQSEQQLPQVQQQVQALAQQLQQWRDRLDQNQHEHQHLQQQMAALPATPPADLQHLHHQCQHHRQHLESLHSQLGSLEQQLHQIRAYGQQLQDLQQHRQTLEHRQRLHQELQLAFSKNGIPALILETILPQIEAEANQILFHLSQGQLTLRFITQKASKRGDKTIETLNIEIADPKGTRPYETYSGGEAFRINFAVRLALSRTLAQRQGCALQTLIIDEGFGSQDHDGCDR
ncbi:MAG: SMC family ATPase [Oscillatoriales cyanobacterium SM2_2_1]|nr:SMC family ATPase [Oscillatoriales cyanobacterium SM2_2_1]